MHNIKSTQTDPPDFGNAKFINTFIANIICKIRRTKSLKIIESDINKNLLSNKISIIILSCKRINSLKRLYSSLKIFLSEIETYKNYEVILVDNGSGNEVINWAHSTNFFNKIIPMKKNIGMCAALNQVYQTIDTEFTMLIEDDFIIKYNKPFMENCLKIFKNFPEIGIIRLKNQNNWGKKFRRIGPIRKINEIKFWTWFPSFNYKHNVWCAGSVIFRHVGYLKLGQINCKDNVSRLNNNHQGIQYEETYGKKFNKIWLAAKIYNCYPFIQLDQDNESPGWSE